MFQAALEALALLGEPSEFISEIEWEIREMLHDMVSPHHTKDLRTFMIWLAQEARHLVLHFIRVSYSGNICHHEIVGPDFQGEEQNHRWALIHNAHCRLLIAPPVMPSVIIADWEKAGVPT